jgi:hypothetical protein
LVVRVVPFSRYTVRWAVCLGVAQLVPTRSCAIVASVDQAVSLLERPVYSYAEVDQLLRLTPGTAKRWIDGYERGGRVYEPVVRPERTDSSWVIWGEFVEARLLAEFRSSVPMIKLRPVVNWLRGRVGQEYPLAYARPFLMPEGRELLVNAQVENQLENELWMVVPSQQGVLRLSPTSTRFTKAVHYPDSEGPAEYVIADPATPDVWLHPSRRQAQPTVDGIRTETLAELVAAGEPVHFVADIRAGHRRVSLASVSLARVSAGDRGYPVGLEYGVVGLTWRFTCAGSIMP